MVAKCDIKWRRIGENQAKGNLERDKIPQMEMDRLYIEQDNEIIAKKARKEEEE
jgi:hypothetical protein